MINGKQLHGLRVMDQNGVQLGVVNDLIADKKSGNIWGFIITLPKFISGSAYLPSSEVIQLNLNGVIISGKDSLRRCKKMKNNGTGTLRIGGFISAKGYVTDLLLEKNQIKAVEISQGVLHDIAKGRQTIPWDEL
jgi:uncharacterized protein YrrD